MIKVGVAQKDYAWWNNKHNWDGITHWSQYIIVSPKFMGPNALPVPKVRNALINEDVQLEAGSDFHFNKGDNTQNLFFGLFLPFAESKIAIEIYGVPLEHYNMDTVTRDERRAREKSTEGFASGDLYFGTVIQLIKNKRNLPDMTISLNAKTASGTNFENARFTDSPGYFFDLF